MYAIIDARTSADADAVSESLIDAVSSGRLTAALVAGGVASASAAGLAKLNVISYTAGTAAAPLPEIRSVAVPPALFTAAGEQGAWDHRTGRPIDPKSTPRRLD